MPKLISLPTYRDGRGSLTVVEKILPFEIKRIYYIYNCADLPRGGHRHKKAIQALICLKGSCAVDWNNGQAKGTVDLNQPDQVLIVLPEDYHVMRDFTPEAVLLVISSEYFAAEDYIDEDY
ncbi:protein cupin-like super family [Candidatus Termititenax persephonae]|uniref:Protein cupin-like super family n=1 Tax=Candidatus Termititenax persephonae TaxID=2218525 RepID=A0A388TF97_9BACT|nr:protein cupin-like super family [Candidatus Termititenax persephonae]